MRISDQGGREKDMEREAESTEDVCPKKDFTQHGTYLKKSVYIQCLAKVLPA